MSTLPFSLRQKDGVVERHELEGNDPSDRYFSRAILVSRIAQGYIGKATYEALTVEGQSHPTIIAAVSSVVGKLRDLGFRRMRTRPKLSKASAIWPRKKPGSNIPIVRRLLSLPCSIPASHRLRQTCDTPCREATVETAGFLHCDE